MEVQAGGKRQNKFVDQSFRHIYNLFDQLHNDTVDSPEDTFACIQCINGYMLK